MHFLSKKRTHFAATRHLSLLVKRRCAGLLTYCCSHTERNDVAVLILRCVITLLLFFFFLPEVKKGFILNAFVFYILQFISSFSLEKYLINSFQQFSHIAIFFSEVPLCPYPGTSKGVTISNVKFYYDIAETIVFGCKDGYKIQGRTVLQCLDGGRWSGTVPACHPIKKG